MLKHELQRWTRARLKRTLVPCLWLVAAGALTEVELTAVTGPAKALPSDFYTTVAEDVGSNAQEEAAIAKSGGRSISLSWSAKASGHTAVVYWGLWKAAEAGISLDDTFVSSGELFSYNSGQSNLGGGTAVWTGRTWMTAHDPSPTQYTMDTRMTLTVRRNSSSGSTVALASPGSVGLDSGLGAVLKMEEGQTYYVNLLIEARSTSSRYNSWRPALDLFNSLSTSTRTGTVFEHGFFYDRGPTGLSMSNQSINENQPSGTIVGTLRADDQDSGGNVSFALAGGSGGDDNSRFRIVNGNQLASGQSFDYETSHQRSVRLRATDEKGSTYDKALTLTINNVNEAPALTSGFTPLTLSEDFGSHSLNVADHFSDVDSSLEYSASIVDGFAGIVSVSIDGNTLNLQSVQDQNGTTQVRVVATEKNQSNPFSVSGVFNVSLTPVNDPPYVSALIPDLSKNEDFGVASLNLDSYFSDVDNPTLTYRVVSMADSQGNASNLVDASISGSTLNFSSTSNANGSAQVTVSASDQAVSASTTFGVQVADVNDPPFFTAGSDQTVNEDSGSIIVSQWAGGINRGASNESAQTLNFTAQNDSPALFQSQPNVSSSGALSFTPASNAFGSANVTVTLRDNGGTAKGGADTSAASRFLITIAPVNDPPTLDPIANIGGVDEEPDPATGGKSVKTVDLSGITVGPGEDSLQSIVNPIQVQVVQSDPPDLISSVTVAHDAGQSTAALQYSLSNYLHGTAQIAVTVQDDGGTSNGGVDALTRQFSVTVDPVDHAPEWTGDLTTGETLNEDESGYRLTLDGLFVDHDGDAFSSLSADSSDLGLASATVQLNGSEGGSIQGVLSVVPVANRFTRVGNGTDAPVAVSLTAIANGKSVQHSIPFTIAEVNDPPTLDPIADQTIDEDSGDQTIALTGLGPGPGEDAIDSVQLNLTEFQSSNPDLIDPAQASIANYDSNAGTATLHYTPAPLAEGVAQVTVTLHDNRGGVLNRTFNVKVNHVNHAPDPSDPLPSPFADSIDPQSGSPLLTYLENSATIELDLSGVFMDPDGDSVTKFVFVNTNHGLVQATAGGERGDRLTLVFSPDASGTADITVEGSDGFLTGTFEFKVLVQPVNGPPTLDPIPAISVAENSGARQIALSGIAPGPVSESGQNIQSITAAVQSQTPDGLIDSLEVDYSPNDIAGSLTVHLSDELSGEALIDVTVQDDGGTDSGGEDTLVRTFKLTVTPVSDAPVLTNPAGSLDYLEDQFADGHFQNMVDLSSVYMDRNDSGGTLSLVIQSIDDPDDVLADEKIDGVKIDPSNPTQLKLTFNPNANGEATVRYKGLSKGLFSTDADALAIRVAPVNDAPVFAAIPNQTVNEDSGPQSVSIRSLSPGPDNESDQTFVNGLSVAVVSESTTGLMGSIVLDTGDGSANPEIRYTPGTDLTGTATVEVTARDDGGTDDGGVDSLTRQFVITIKEQDDPPALALPYPDQSFLEDQFASNDNAQTLDLTGVFADPDGASVALTIGFIQDPSDVLDDENGNVLINPAHPAQIQAAFKPNAFGTASITVAGSANGLIAADTDTFDIQVQPVNDAPGFDEIPDQTVTADSGGQSLTITGLNAGPLEQSSQSIQSIAALILSQGSANVLMDDPVVEFTTGETSAILRYTLTPGMAGTATVRVTVQDDGGTGNGGVDSYAQDFLINVAPARVAPSLQNPIGAITYSEDDVRAFGLAASVDLRGVYTEGNGRLIELLIDSVSDPDQILDKANVQVDPDRAEFINLAFQQDAYGTAAIKYRAISDRLISSDTDTLTIVVTPTNDAPTLDPILRQTVTQASGSHAVALTGIGPGAGEAADQDFEVSAEIVTQNPDGLISSLNVSHTGSDGNGTLTYALSPDGSGTATIRVTVQDEDGHVFHRDFRVVVLGADDAPVLVQPFDDQTFLEDEFASQQNQTTLDLSGVFADAEMDGVSLVLQSVDDPDNVLSDETGGVRVRSGNPEQLLLTFIPDAFGTASLTVGAFANGRPSSDSTTFNVAVTPVNDPPILDAISTQHAQENEGTLSIGLKGIATGPANESGQNIKSIAVEIVSQTPGGLIDGDPVVTHSGNDATGTLRVNLTENANGTATLKVTVTDDGGREHEPLDSFSRTFLVEVDSVDQAPRLVGGMGSNSVSLTEEALESNQFVSNVDLSGVFEDPDGDAIQLILASIEDPEDILDNESPGKVRFLPDNPETLQLAAIENAYGTATLAFQALAKGKFSADGATLTVEITPANGAPSFDAIADQTVAQDTGRHSFQITGIRPGAVDSGAAQVTQIQARILSSNPEGLLSSPPEITYNPGDEEAQLSYAPAAGMRGTATIQVTVTDDGNVDNGRVNTFSRQFNIQVTERDNPPALAGDSTLTKTYLEDAFLSSANLTSIDLSGLFADPDGDAIVLDIADIQDDGDLLDDEGGNVAVDPFETQQLSVLFKPHANGGATITLDALANGLRSSDQLTLRINVTPVNDPPTIQPVPSVQITQAQDVYTIPLSGISTGPANEASQSLLPLTVAIEQQSPSGLVVNPSVLHDGNDPAGSLQFSLAKGLRGNASFRLTLQDNGGTQSGGSDTESITFALSAQVANKPPALTAPIGAVSYDEDAFAESQYQTSLDLSGDYEDPEDDAITLVLKAVQDPDDVLNDETAGGVRLDAGSSALSLTFKPNAFGTAQVSYQALAAGQFSSDADTLTITVHPVNDPPTIDPPPDLALMEGGADGSVSLTGIGVGARESSAQTIQSVQASVTSVSPSDLFQSDPFIVYAAGDRAAALNYTLTPNRNGSATIQITVQDDGGSEGAGSDAASVSFQVNVAPVDHPPELAETLPADARPAPFLEDQFAGQDNQTQLDLAGLFIDPDGDSVLLSVGAISDPDDILNNETGGVKFDSSNGGRLILTFQPNGFGQATIPIQALANGRNSESAYSLQITVTGVNDAPQIDAIADRTVVAGSGDHSVGLTGIRVGPRESAAQNIESVTVQIQSQEPDGLFAAAPTIEYSPNDRTGTLNYSLNPDVSGTAVIRVAVQDDGGTDNQGANQAFVDFNLQVNPPPPVDHPPELVAPKGTVSFTVDQVNEAEGRRLEVDLSGVYSDPDGDAISLALISVGDASNILANETSGNIAFEEDDPLTLSLAFHTNATGTASVTYMALANGRLANTADVMTVVVDDANGASVEPGGNNGIALSQLPRAMALGTPRPGATLLAVVDGRYGASSGMMYRWEIADNDLGVHARTVHSGREGELELKDEMRGRFVRFEALPAVQLSSNSVSEGPAIYSPFLPVGGVLERFEDWREVRLPSDLNSYERSPSGDPDRDGWTNAAEYWMGLDPMGADTHDFPPPWIEGEGSALALRIPMVLNKSRKDVDWRIEISDDMETWKEAEMEGEVVLRTDWSEKVNFELAIENGMQFIRMRARILEDDE